MEEYFQYLLFAIIFLLLIVNFLNYFLLKQIIEIKKFSSKLPSLDNIEDKFYKLLELIEKIKEINERIASIQGSSNDKLKSIETFVSENQNISRTTKDILEFLNKEVTDLNLRLAELTKYKDYGDKIFSEIHQINLKLKEAKDEIDRMFNEVLEG